MDTLSRSIRHGEAQGDSIVEGDAHFPKNRISEMDFCKCNTSIFNGNRYLVYIYNFPFGSLPYPTVPVQVAISYVGKKVL
jgi:hypothetical protein